MAAAHRVMGIVATIATLSASVTAPALAAAQLTSDTSGYREVLELSDRPLKHDDSPSDTGGKPSPMDRIVGGTPIGIASAPYQVFIADVDLASGRFTAFCSGSVYHREWVITAAHCVQRAETWADGRLRIGFGTNDLSSVPLSQFRSVTEIIAHPEWNSTTFANDIAMLRLSAPLPIEPGRVEPVSLPISLPVAWPAAGTTGQVAGWGLLRHGTQQTSTVLQAATVRALTDIGDPNCGRYGDYDSLYRADTMLCAGVPEAPIGVCNGESGGGLVVSMGDVHYLAGITSWSIGCGGEFNDGTTIVFDDWPGVYTRVTAFNNWIRATTSTAPPPPPPFDPQQPSRIYDTRSFTVPLAPGQIAQVALPDELAGASAAVVNVTATTAFADGFFTVFACGEERPATSNGNYVGISTIANNVIAPIGEDLSICIETGQAEADIIVDLFDFYPDSREYRAVTPTRLFDSRTAQGPQSQLSPDIVTAIRMPPSVPDDVNAVALNVTVANAIGDGFVSVSPCGQPHPATSSVNYVGLDTVANNVITGIGRDRSVCIRTGQAAADIIVDLMGYYPATSSTTAVTPMRLFDTRNGVGPLRADDTLVVDMGRDVPDGATTALINVTAVNADADGFITVYPCGRPVPATSNANFVGISTIANNVITAIGENRSVCIRTGQATADVVVDLVGYATD